MLPKLLAASALLALTACGTYSTSWDREVGSEVDKGQFGNATMNNTLIQTGEMSYTVALAERFAAEVPDTINFAFNSAELSDEARSTLKKQADFIRQFPEVRFRVFGHTDKVGSNGYNQRLGLRRAQAAVAYLTGPLKLKEDDDFEIFHEIFCDINERLGAACDVLEAARQDVKFT